MLKMTFPINDGESGEYPLTKRGYWVGLSIILASAYSQYLVQGLGPLLVMLFVYGAPIGAVSYLFGFPILRKAFRHNAAALKLGLGLFGLFCLLGILAASSIFRLIVMADPQAANFLNRPNPVLHVPPKFAWVMVWLSLLVVGPVEEYIFRGFVYGGLLNLFKSRHWLGLAFFSSALFAIAHLYYALVYGIASLIIFVELFAVGTGLAVPYYLSGGNLFIPIILHGLYDATGFLAVAVSEEVGILLRTSMIGVGIIVAFVLFLRAIFLRQ
jgi:membrane protease YdiL (CAAX protease family)